MFSSEVASSEAVALEQVDEVAVKFDETAAWSDSFIKRSNIDESAELAYPEIMMMTFRSNEITDDAATTDGILDGDIVGEVKSEELPVDVDVSVLMTMTGAVDDLANLADETEIRTLSVEDDQVDLTSVIDDVISDEDLIFYSMGPGAEVETTSVEEPLTPEDVNGDGSVTAIDMLLVLNVLNSYGAMPSSQLAALSEISGASNWDINRDGYVTPLDTLVLTNYFNGLGSAELADEADSSQSLLAAPAVARIRNPAEDAPLDESAPLIEEKFDAEILERA